MRGEERWRGRGDDSSRKGRPASAGDGHKRYQRAETKDLELILAVRFHYEKCQFVHLMEIDEDHTLALILINFQT